MLLIGLLAKIEMKKIKKYRQYSEVQYSKVQYSTSFSYWIELK